MKVACDTSSSIPLFSSIGKGSSIDTLLVQPKPLLLKTQSFRNRNQKETEANREIQAILLYRPVLDEEETEVSIKRTKSAQQLRQTGGFCSPPLRTRNPICYDKQFEDRHEKTEDELGLFKFSP